MDRIDPRTPAAPDAPEHPAPHFDAPCGPIIGRRDGDLLRATGIPYARAARSAPPVAPADRDEALEATGWSPQCPQDPDPSAEEIFGPDLRQLPVSEDCQHLSITMPAAPSAAPRPVMVWIHGGGFVTGAGDLAVMDPAALVREQDVIVVAVTYRLGLLGFVGPHANLGLLDVIAALRWVRRNIGAFGGDPHRVTVFGQSAGAAAIGAIMTTGEAPELFSRAILQSPPLGIMRGRGPLEQAIAPEAAGLDPRASLDEVLAAQRRVLAAGARFGLRGGMPIAPQAGAAPLPPEDQLDAALARTAPRIDVLIGCTSEEARLFLPHLPGAARWRALPLAGPLLERAVVALATRLVYTRAAGRFARRHRHAGGRARTYRLSWAGAEGTMGAAHTVDLPLLLGDEEAWRGSALLGRTPWRGVDADGRLLREAWARFARGEDVAARGRLREFLRFDV